MRKYKIKRDKAYYDGYLRCLENTLSDIDDLIVHTSTYKENIGLWQLRDKLYNDRAEVVKNIRSLSKLI